ncbi:XisH family protein [Candidatus Amarolinea dominans]|uniref:XisH family protein n=1 Tax=Candidatus Amarolinea dominans TaxID=3140696 RepID=UPI0031372E89|nr:XisH family protein [Anaerolineae bacterium]
MPARDLYHDIVRNALIKDGWTITHDPFHIGYGDVDIYVDLAAEQPIAAEKEGRKIAVEVKSFLGYSVVRDVEQALGQYVLYRSIIEEVDSQRVLYLAIDMIAYESVLQRAGFQMIIAKNNVNIIVVELKKEEIVKWTH